MKTKRYLLIVSHNWGTSLRTTYDHLSLNGEVQVVSFSPSSDRNLRAIGLKFEQVADYATDPEEFDVTRVAVGKLNELPSTDVGDRSLGAWLMHENISYWPFISPNLFADLNALIKNIVVLNKIIDKEKPDCVVGIDTSKLPFFWNYLRGVSKENLLVDRLLLKLVEQKGIGWRPIKPNLAVRLNLMLTNLMGRMFSFMRGGVILTLLASCIRRLMSKFVRLVRGKLKTGGIIFFSHSKYWRRDLNPFNNTLDYTDTSIYPVVKTLIDDGENVNCLDGNYSFLGSLSALWQKLWNEKNVDWDCFDTWYPFVKIGQLRSIGSKANKALENHKENIFSDAGVSLDHFLLPRFKFLLLDYLWKSGIWIEAGRNLLREMKPEVVVLTYETGTLSRAIINACKESGTPSIGVQHGAFSESTDDYMRTEQTHIRNFVPDITAVWGERFRRLLVHKSVYDEGEVAVTGNPRMDFLVEAHSLLDKQMIYRKYSLDPTRLIVLAAPTETIGRTESTVKNRFFEGIVQAAMDDTEVQWVIKLKPGAADEEYYHEYLRELDDVSLIVTQEDLYPLLTAAQVVVTPPSSVAIEALLMRKPVIYVAFPDAEDYFPHLIEAGAVLLDRDMSELLANVHRLSTNFSSGLLSEDKLEEVLSEENYKPDGHASKRIANLIFEYKTKIVSTALNRK